MTSSASEPTLDLSVPFLLEQALAYGVHPRELRTSKFHRIFTGIYVASSTALDPLTRARAALLLFPRGAHLSHMTAAVLYGLPVSDRSSVHVTVGNAGERVYRPGIKPHARTIGSDVSRVQGLPASAPLQLFVELASVLPLVETVVVGDAMVRLGLTSVRALVTHCESLRGKRNSRLARRAAAYVREGVDSPMETRLRMLLVLAGLPEPQVNFKLRDEYGAVLRRFDLSYPHAKIIVEYDGRDHILRVAQWSSDIERREEFDDDEWRTLIVTSAGVFRDPGRTIQRVRRALRSRGAPTGRRSEAWRAHFPGS